MIVSAVETTGVTLFSVPLLKIFVSKMLGVILNLVEILSP